MKQTFRLSVKHLIEMTLLFAAFLLLISMTGCASRLVVVDGGAEVTIKKSQLDLLYSDNEAVLKALEECRSGR